MHLQIMKRAAQSQGRRFIVIRPNATAFAVAGVEPPTCMIPEIEVFWRGGHRALTARRAPRKWASSWPTWSTNTTRS